MDSIKEVSFLSGNGFKKHKKYKKTERSNGQELAFLIVV